MGSLYNLNNIYMLSESELDDYISNYTKEKHVSLSDKRYTTLHLLDRNNLLDDETHRLVKSPELFEALKIGEDDPEQVKIYLNPNPNYAQQHRNIVLILQRLSHIYDLLGSTCIGNAPRSGTCSTQNHFRSRAFNNSANQMNEYFGPLNVEDLSQIPGIGSSSLEVITDVINNGRSKRLDLLEDGKDENGNQIFDPEMLKSLDEFRTIHGVGPKNALDFYREGYRSLKDLEKSTRLTDTQKLGLKHHEVLKQHIPRSEMDAWVKFFSHFFGNSPESEKGYIWAITGSYRRNEPTSSDIDLIVMNSKISDIVKTLNGYIVGTFASGPDKFLGIIQAPNTLPRRIDIRLFPKESWFYGLLYNTGSLQFTIMMRQRAKKLGYHLDEYKLVDDKGNHLPANREKDIFNHLKVQYLSPEQRTSMLNNLTLI